MGRRRYTPERTVHLLREAEVLLRRGRTRSRVPASQHTYMVPRQEALGERAS